MARGSTVKLSITSAFDDKGTKAAERAMAGFEKKAEAMGGSNAFASAMASKSVAFEQFGSKLDRMGGSMVAAGAAATKGLTVPIAAAATACVAAASGMESAFANVRKTVDATDEEYARLYDSAIQLSKAHPISAADVAMIQSLGAQLGISTGSLAEFAEVVYGLDIATDLDAESAATQLAQFANICGTAETKLANVGSTVVALGNTSATTESVIMAMGMRIAASGTQAGMSEANILAVSAALASLGMEAEAGGTAMSATLNRISTDVATNSANVETWAALAGQSVEEFSAAWAAGGDVTTEAFARVVQGMAKTTDEGGNLTVLLDELGISGIRQSDAMKRLASSGDLLADSIKTANTAYAENTALGREVANFEDTFASKLETTKNQAVAVAIELGGPMLDALSAALDASQPLIEAAAEMAESFADMDEEGQREVLTFLAVAAAIGPVTMAAGKLVQAGGSVVTAAGKISAKMAEWSAASKATSTAQGALASNSKAAASATTAQANATKNMSAVSNAAKGALVGLAVAGVALLVSHIATAIERQKSFEQATGGLRAASAASTSASAESAEAISAVGANAGKAKADIDGLIDSQAQLAQRIRDTNDAAKADVTVLERYQEEINELANKSGLAEEEQARLQLAVDGVNGILGTNIEVFDAANGIIGETVDVNGEATQSYYDNLDAVNAVIEAKQTEIQLDASRENATELIKAQQEASEQLAAAYIEQATAQEDYDRALQATGGSINGNSHALDYQKSQLDEANGKVREATELTDAASTALRNEELKMIRLQQAADGTATEMTIFMQGQELLNDIIDTNGYSLEDFQAQLEQTGVSTESLAGLSAEQLANLGTSYDGTIGSIETALSAFGVTAPSAAQKAAQGVRTLTEKEVNALPGTFQAAADGAMGNFNGALYRYDGKSAAWVKQLSGTEVNGVKSAFSGAANGAVGEFNGALYRYDGASGRWVAQRAKDSAGSVSAYGAGQSFTYGFSGGISSAVGAACNSAASMAVQALNAAKAAIDSRSPSRAAAKIGRTVPQGFAVGIEQDAHLAAEASAASAEGALAAAAEALDSTPLRASLPIGAATASDMPASSAASAAEAVLDDTRIVNAIGALGGKLDRICTTLEQIRDRQLTIEWNQREMARVIGIC